MKCCVAGRTGAATDAQLQGQDGPAAGLAEAAGAALGLPFQGRPRPRDARPAAGPRRTCRPSRSGPIPSIPPHCRQGLTNQWMCCRRRHVRSQFDALCPVHARGQGAAGGGRAAQRAPVHLRHEGDLYLPLKHPFRTRSMLHELKIPVATTHTLEYRSSFGPLFHSSKEIVFRIMSRFTIQNSQQLYDLGLQLKLNCAEAHDVVGPVSRVLIGSHDRMTTF